MIESNGSGSDIARSPGPRAGREPSSRRQQRSFSWLSAHGRLWALGSGLLLCSLIACHKAPPPPPPSVPVGVATVRRMDVPLLVQATGTVEPIRTVAVQAQVSGLLLHVRFKEGDEVREGQVLFEIDPRTFAAALDQAQGTLARDQASWTSAQHDVARYQALASKEYVTQQQLDQARAAANALAGTMRADSAAIDQAKLNLQYATIRAPITGRAGSVLVKEGNQVRGGAAQTLVVINQISPILVRFPVPAAYFDNVRRHATDRSLVVHVTPIGDSTASENGSLVFLDNAVDSSTSTVLLKANFANSRGALWPGALETVALQLDVERNALVVPSSAVQSGQSGSVVWIVDSARKVHVVKVKVLRSTDSLSILSGGVSEGQRVVTDGQLRLTDGVRVAIRGEGGAAGTRSDSSAGGDVIDTGHTGGRKGAP
jgi:multidrug efflux system membrane fusion protein